VLEKKPVAAPEDGRTPGGLIQSAIIGNFRIWVKDNSLLIREIRVKNWN
jgi:hypothetical protein